MAQVTLSLQELVNFKALAIKAKWSYKVYHGSVQVIAPETLLQELGYLED